MKSSKYQPFILSLIGGLLYATGFPSFLGESTLIGPLLGFSLLLSSLWASKTLKFTIGVVLSFSFGYYCLGYYWIPQTIHDFGGLIFPFNYLFGSLFTLFIVPQFLVFGVLWKCFSQKKNALSKSPLLWACLLTLLEYYIPQQFRAHIGHPWLTLAPRVGWAPIVGGFGYSFFSFWLSCTAVHAIKTKNWKSYFPSLILCLGFFISSTLVPLPREPKEYSEIHIRMVQPNIGNFVKVQAEEGIKGAVDKVMEFYKSGSLAPSSGPLDLIIWPETAYPKVLLSKFLGPKNPWIPPLVKDVIEKSQAELVFGGYDVVKPEKTDYYEREANSAFHFHPQKGFVDVYHKMKLIPFGETLPLGPLKPYVAKIIKNISYFYPGTKYQTFYLKDRYPFFIAICYEILFPSFTRKFIQRMENLPLFIINLTNDSWYGDTAEPYQHKFLARWRSLELQIPTLRSTNTGVTSVLLPNGKESLALDVGAKGKLDVKVKIPKKFPATFFYTWGPLSLVLFWLFLFLLGWIFRKRILL